MKIVFEKGKNYPINYFSNVKVTKYADGKTIIRYVGRKSSNLSKYKRINNHEFVNTEDGNILEYNISSKKSTKAIKRTIREKLRPILENNFFGEDNELFVTLTFKRDMSDFSKLTNYFNKFWNRLCYKYKNLNLACVYVKEMQQDRNSWHYHLMIKEKDGEYLYIARPEMEAIWKYGYCKVSRVVKYKIANHSEINEEMDMKIPAFIPNHKRNYRKVIDYMCKLETKDGDIPSNGRIFGSKGNMKLPSEEENLYGKVHKELYKNHKIVKDSTLLIKNEETGNIVNNIHKQIWILDKKKMRKYRPLLE